MQNTVHRTAYTLITDQSVAKPESVAEETDGSRQGAETDTDQGTDVSDVETDEGETDASYVPTVADELSESDEEAEAKAEAELEEAEAEVEADPEAEAEGGEGLTEAA